MTPLHAIEAMLAKCTPGELLPCPETLFTSYCPKHKRGRKEQTGFRCICAELELAYISGQGDSKRSGFPSEAVKMGCDGLLGPTVKIFATELRRAIAPSLLRELIERLRKAEKVVVAATTLLDYQFKDSVPATPGPWMDIGVALAEYRALTDEHKEPTK